MVNVIHVDLDMVFTDRLAAGRLLVASLDAYKDLSDLIVVGLAQSGIMVASQVAQRMGAPLDMIFTKQRESIPPKGKQAGKPVRQQRDPVFEYCMDGLLAKERRQSASREAVLRQGLSSLQWTNRTVLFVDDGAATFHQLRSALESVWSQQPKAVSIAIPVTTREIIQELQEQVRDLIYLVCVDSPFRAADQYGSFPPVSDDEIRTTVTGSRALKRGDSHLVQTSGA